MLKIQYTPLEDCFLLEPAVFRDQRGSFQESFNQRRFEQVTGLQKQFVQDNQSTSSKDVLRGLHFQKGSHAQSKLVRCAFGEVLDVVVDLRPDSPTYKKSFKVLLSSDNKKQLYVPAGFAHGFLTLSEISVFSYKCDRYYNKEADSGIFWNDPELDLDWDLKGGEPLLSEKDLNLPLLKDLEL